MSKETTSCIPLSSETVKTCATEAWTEVRPIAEAIPKPKMSPLGRFFPTDACAAPINAAISELKARKSFREYTVANHLLI